MPAPFSYVPLPLQRCRILLRVWSPVSPTKRHVESLGHCGTILASFSATGFVAAQTDPANAGVSGEFLLGIFPPDHGDNHAPPTPPEQQTLKK
jgi:hypothetical protein